MAQPIEISPSQIARRSEQKSEERGVVYAEPNSKKVGVTTLGCKVNTFESELIAEALQTQSWQVVPHTEKADLYVINTCTVTREPIVRRVKRCAKL